MNIEEILKDLDKNLKVIDTKRKNKTFYITCEINKTQSECPFCHCISNSIHSKYIRTLSDLPIQNNVVKLLLITKKFFCLNPECSHKTFGERYSFVEPNSVKTNRLIKYINKIGLRDNSMDAVRSLKESGINVSGNTVLRIVKKNRC